MTFARGGGSVRNAGENEYLEDTKNVARAACTAATRRIIQPTTVRRRDFDTSRNFGGYSHVYPLIGILFPLT